MTRVTGTLREDRCTFMITRYVADKSCRENQNAHFMCSNFFFENLAFYEIMWKNLVESDNAQMTI